MKLVAVIGDSGLCLFYQWVWSEGGLMFYSYGHYRKRSFCHRSTLVWFDVKAMVCCSCPCHCPSCSSTPTSFSLIPPLSPPSSVSHSPLSSLSPSLFLSIYLSTPSLTLCLSFYLLCSLLCLCPPIMFECSDINIYLLKSNGCCSLNLIVCICIAPFLVCVPTYFAIVMPHKRWSIGTFPNWMSVH